MKRLAIGVGLVELIWHLGSASRRLKKLLGLFVVLCALGALASPAAAFTIPPGVYGPYELTFQNVEYGYRWTHVHYEYIRRILPTLYELCRAEKYVTHYVWHFVEIAPESIFKTWRYEEYGYHSDCPVPG